jgi:hypothetical protein
MNGMWNVVLLLGAAVVGCGGGSRVGVGSGNNYSSTPCVDNCGSDTQCQAACQDVNNQGPLPAGAQPAK